MDYHEFSRVAVQKNEMTLLSNVSCMRKNTFARIVVVNSVSGGGRKEGVRDAAKNSEKQSAQKPAKSRIERRQRSGRGTRERGERDRGSDVTRK